MDKKMMIYDAVKIVPDNAKRPIVGGRLKGKTDINPMWRIKALTEQFGPCGIGWYYIPTKKWLEAYGEEIAAFVDIELYICVDGVWSKPIFGTGGSMFVAIEKSGTYVSDECYKMATTDALSVACKQLGIGADVYWEGDKSKYDYQEPQTEAVERLTPVYEELKRIGYSPKSICLTYKIEDINDMSDLQIKDFLQKAKKLPNKGEM